MWSLQGRWLDGELMRVSATSMYIVGRCARRRYPRTRLWVTFCVLILTCVQYHALQRSSKLQACEHLSVVDVMHVIL